MLTFVRGDTTKMDIEVDIDIEASIDIDIEVDLDIEASIDIDIEITARESEHSHEPSDILNSTPNNSNCSHHI